MSHCSEPVRAGEQNFKFFSVSDYLGKKISQKVGNIVAEVSSIFNFRTVKLFSDLS